MDMVDQPTRNFVLGLGSFPFLGCKMFCRKAQSNGAHLEKLFYCGCSHNTAAAGKIRVAGPAAVFGRLVLVDKIKHVESVELFEVTAKKLMIREHPVILLAIFTKSRKSKAWNNIIRWHDLHIAPSCQVESFGETQLPTPTRTRVDVLLSWRV